MGDLSGVTPPSYFVHASYAGIAGASAVFYQGQSPAPQMVISQATPTTYTVLDWWGNVVSTGAVSGTSVTPTAPSGGWKCGWYRVRFTGSTTGDPNYADSYGATSFIVIPPSSNFPPIGTTNSSGSSGAWTNDPPNPRLKGCLGIGPSRLQISSTTDLTSGGASLTQAEANAKVENYFWTDPVSGTAAYQDSARPRYAWCSFPNGTMDNVVLPATSSQYYVFAYAKTPTLQASGNVYVAFGAGSSSGAKITVYYPNTSTLVETWDNLASPTAAQSIVSSYIRCVLPSFNTGTTPSTLAPTAIANTRYNNVSAAVAALYPLGITRFEGPRNEPSQNENEIIHTMMLFQAAVHAGNAS